VFDINITEGRLDYYHCNFRREISICVCRPVYVRNATIYVGHKRLRFRK